MFGVNNELLLELDKKHEEYINNDPFPHIIIDNLFDDSILQQISELEYTRDDWKQEFHARSLKLAKNSPESFNSDITKKLIETLNSNEFTAHIEALTGVKNIVPDNTLKGGGLHYIPRNGFLGIHTDFTSKKHTNLFRRLNILIYLNRNWKREWEGNLELWNKDGTKMVKEIMPIFNRTVIFNTDRKSFHGHPRKLMCPEDIGRKSIALYYYSYESSDGRTDYQRTLWKTEALESILKK